MIALASRLRGETMARPLGPINPFEAERLVTAAWYGGLLLTGISQSQAIRDVLPPLLQTVWAATLLIGGVVSLAGLFWVGDPFTAVEIKRVGLVAAGVAALAYGVALLVAHGWAGAGFAGGYFGFSAACGFRVLQIRGSLRRSVRFLHNEARRRKPPPGGG